MRKFILPLILVASLAAPSLAMAAASTAEGTIKSLDAKAWTLVLSDGTSYTLAKTIKVSDLKGRAKELRDKLGGDGARAADRVDEQVALAEARLAEPCKLVERMKTASLARCADVRP